MENILENTNKCRQIFIFNISKLMEKYFRKYNYFFNITKYVIIRITIPLTKFRKPKPYQALLSL